jgi:transposase
MRIRDIINGQLSLFELPADIEKAAQYYAGLIVQARGRAVKQQDGNERKCDYQRIDVNSLELTKPRSVGAEHVSWQTLRTLRIDEKLEELGFNKHQKNAAVGMIIGRMVEPGSELAAHSWLRDRSGLGELIDYDFAQTSLSRVYRASDLLLKHKEEIETFVYAAQKCAFEFEETITLYDLTNTYFEGSGKLNKNAAFGRSKEKRSDCPLVTLALVLDGSGFPKRSEVFEGNASEPKTLKEMLAGLGSGSRDRAREEKQGTLFDDAKPLVVMDAGIATEENVEFLKNEGFRYLVVGRKRHRVFSEENAVEVKNDRDYRIRVCKVANEKTGEIELYCHSSRKESKEKAMADRASMRFEAELAKLNEGLEKKGCTKKYEKVMEKIGRLKQKYSKAAKNYVVNVKKRSKGGNAKEVAWKTKDVIASQDAHPGVYCLRTNWDAPDEVVLWRTYTMLTDLEAVFRSLKSELGLRPVCHQKTKRVSGHLFITVLAYHLVHNIRRRLKEKHIHSSWETLRKQLASQCRVTTTMNREDGRTIHVRKSTKPEPAQKAVYDALKITCAPGKEVKTTI